MIILRKKRIVIISICLVLSFCFIAVFQNKNNSMEKILPVVSLPVSNKVIVLDAGHGDPDRRGRK